MRLLDRVWSAPVLLLAITALMWAGNTIAGRLAVGHISPMLLTALRWTFVLALLWPIFGREVRDHWSEIRPVFPRLAVLAALGYTGFNAFYYVAAHYTSAINLGILQGSIPVFVLIGAFLAHGTRASVVQILGVITTLIGVIVVASQGDFHRLLALAFNIGDVFVLAACVFYAIYTVGLKNRPTMSGAGFFTLLAAVAAATSIPLVAWEYASGQLQWPTLRGWALTLWIALFPSCLSQLTYLRGVDLIGPSRAGVYVNLVPIFAAFLAVGLLAEPFGVYHAVALALVLGGIWLTQRTG
jgi:drug/metabolite transporter (DMT)-like permease